MDDDDDEVRFSVLWYIDEMQNGLFSRGCILLFYCRIAAHSLSRAVGEIIRSFARGMMFILS